MSDESSRLLDLLGELVEHEDPKVRELVVLATLLVREHQAAIWLQRDAERAYRRIAFALDPRDKTLQR